MIKVQNLTPDVFYKQSRDFQFIGRLYDLVLNSVKTNTEILYNLPLNDDSPDNIADLLALTLGFKVKHHYTAKQLKLLCSVLPLALKNKGSIKAMEIVANTLINAEGCSKSVEYNLEENNTVLNLYLPPEVNDTTILIDVFNYILPAGMRCNIIKQVVYNQVYNTEIGLTDKLGYYGLDTSGNPSNTLVDNTTYTKDSSTIAVIEANSQGKLTDTNLIDLDPKNTAGVISNTMVYKDEQSAE